MTNVLIGVHGAGLMFIMFAADEVGVCMYVCMYLCMYVCMGIFCVMFQLKYIHMSTVCMNEVYLSMLYVPLYVCMYVCMLCMYAFMPICTYL